MGTSGAVRREVTRGPALGHHRRRPPAQNTDPSLQQLTPRLTKRSLSTRVEVTRGPRDRPTNPRAAPGLGHVAAGLSGPLKAQVEKNGQKWPRKRGAFPANREHEPQVGGFVERSPDLESQPADFPQKIASMSLNQPIFRKKSRP